MEKVYGICGDNKCRRQVMPEGNFAYVQKKVPAGQKQFAELPDGFGKSRTNIIGVKAGTASYSYGVYNPSDLIVEITNNDQIKITNNSDSAQYITITLYKITDEDYK